MRRPLRLKTDVIRCLMCLPPKYWSAAGARRVLGSKACWAWRKVQVLLLERECSFQTSTLMQPWQLSAPLFHLLLFFRCEGTMDKLYRSLWSWGECNKCSNRGCSIGSCRWALGSFLSSYQEFCVKITHWYTSENWTDALPAIREHCDLHDLVRFIAERSYIPRENLMSEYFGNKNCSQIDNDRAFNLAFSAITMITCSNWNPHHHQYPILPPLIWKRRQSAWEVLNSAHSSGTPLTRDEIRTVNAHVTAEQLQACGLAIVSTNDLRLHLELDEKSRRVYVYHQAGFLRCHLDSQTRCNNTSKWVPATTRF